jgi:hypothetical protein
MSPKRLAGQVGPRATGQRNSTLPQGECVTRLGHEACFEGAHASRRSARIDGGQPWRVRRWGLSSHLFR